MKLTSKWSGSSDDKQFI